MFQESFSGLDKDLHLHFERGHADAHLSGVDETYVRVQGEGEASDYNVQWKNGTLTMNLDEDCRFFIPRTLNVQVSGQFGDLRASELAGNLSLDGSMGDIVISRVTGRVQIGEVAGDLKANELGALTITGELHGDAQIVAVGDGVQLQGVRGDLHITEVGAVNVSDNINGSARINSVRGSINLSSVAGDLVVSGAEALNVGSVGSDFRASGITGNINVGGVGGDAKLLGIAGDVNLSEVGGDARLVDVSGRVNSLSAGGDLVLETHRGFSPEHDYSFSAGGDLVVTLPEGATAKINASAGGEIISKFGGEKHVHAEHGAWQAEIGKGGPAVNLSAGGDIKIKAQREGNVEFHKEIIEEEMRRAKDEVRRAKDELKRVKHEMREQQHRWRDEIKRNVHVNINRELRHGLRGLRRHFDVHVPEPPEPPRPPKPPKAPSFSFSFGFGKQREPSKEQPAAAPKPKQGPSEEERMTILKMLAEKRITAEQAEMLFGALGEE